jgi:hypothetical protein
MGKHVSLEPLVHSWNPPPSSQEEVLAGKQHARPPMLGFFSQKNLIESPRDHRHPVLHLKLCCFIIQKNPLKFENPSKRQTLKKPKKFLADYWILLISLANPTTVHQKRTESSSTKLKKMTKKTMN